MWSMYRKILRIGRVTAPAPKSESAGILSPLNPATPALPGDPPLVGRGLPELVADRCTACRDCANVCPTDAITITAPPGADRLSHPRDLQLNVDLCFFCGACVDACLFGALVEGGRFDLAHRPVSPPGAAGGPGHPEAPGAPGPPDAPFDAGAMSEILGSTLRRKVARGLGRSLHIRHLDAGSCNGCDWEMTSLLNPYYDLQRFGVDFVASPRHADMVMVTGPVTRNLREAVLRTVEAAPRPCLVVAVGACACGGGFSGPSYATVGGVNQVLPVDVHIPGCPPRPEALIRGILLALGRL